jgi:ABC-type multidrug transport system fused ATPase/permease subunit
VFEVMDAPPAVLEPAHPLTLPPALLPSTPQPPADAQPSRSRQAPSALLPHSTSPPTTPSARAPSLQARDLRFRYPGQSRWALDGVDLDLRPGRRVAVVGPSGAGKSTLAGILLRFLPYEGFSDKAGSGKDRGVGGSVTLDGIELAELDGDQVRRAVGLVSQDAHVFDNTLEENLRLAKRNATEKELDDALAAARLLAWTRELPAGLRTEVGERGARMSGGQRQRLAIARALLADFPVLVLDEPGEHLDTQTADAVVADLLAVTEGRTTLLITHRLKGLEEVDEVLVLDHGRVLERGTHGELLALGERYAELWRREQETGQLT